MKVWSVIFAICAVAALGFCIISAVWVPVVLMMVAMSAAAWYDADPRDTEEDSL